MAAWRSGVIQANFQSHERDSVFQTMSTYKSRVTKLHGVTQRASQKSSQSSTFRCVFAVSVASLILVYVLLRCFQYVFNVPEVAAATRSLAAGGSRQGSCPHWPNNEDTEEVCADEGAKAAAGLPAAEGGAQVPPLQQGGASNPLQPPVSGWEFQQMSPQWVGRAAGLLYAVKNIASTYMSLFPYLEASQAVKLCQWLMQLAVLELTSLAYVPRVLQPLRSEAASAFSLILERVLSDDATRKAGRKLRLHSKLHNLNRLIGEIGAPPAGSVFFQNYKAMLTSCLNTTSYTLTQVSALLESLMHVHEEQNTIDTQTIQQVSEILRAIFHTRRIQLVRIQQLRDLLFASQAEIAASPIFTKRAMHQGPGDLGQQPAVEVNAVDEVANAIMTAGGSPVSSTLTSLSGEDEPSPQPSAMSDYGEDLQLQGTQHHHPGPPVGPLGVPPPGQPEPVELLHHPSDQPLQPQTHDQISQPDSSPAAHPAESPRTALSSQVSQQPQAGPPTFELLGARPRQQRALLPRSRAEWLGWAYRRMPQNWLDSFKELFELMRTVANTCSSLLPSLYPSHAVLLALHLSMVVTLQISALAYLPADLQPLRQAVGASYRQLIEIILTTESTRSAATGNNVTGRLECARVALERLSGVPGDINIAPNEYMRRTCIQYRLCKYVTMQVVSLLEELMPSPLSSGRTPASPAAIIKAVASMVPALKMHLLVDTLLRGWFVSQASSLEYPSCTSEDLDKASKRKNLSTKDIVKRLRRILVKAGVQPIALEKGDSPFETAPKSTKTQVGEHSSAGLKGPGPQDSQQQQPAPPAPHSPLVAPADEDPFSQLESTPAISFQPPGQPGPPSSSTVPSHTFDLPHWSVWTWLPDDQHHSQAQHPQTSFGAPSFLWSAPFSGLADGGVFSSWHDDGQAQGNSGGAGGALGLLDLAARVSQLGPSHPQEDGEGERSPGGAGGELDLLGLASHASQGSASDWKEEEEDD
ncbi:hypothetical protein ACSSS7_003187 [Eimeria intestinalis]